MRVDHSVPSAARTLWRAYFYLALSLVAADLALTIFVDTGQEPAWWEWVSTPLNVFQVVGLFGFAYWRRLVVQPLWQFVFIASIAHEAWSVYATVIELEPGALAPGVMAATIAATLLIQVPMWIGLFLYGFRCRELWRDAH